MTSVSGTGHVTFLFTDIEGSTRLWEREAARMAKALARHDALARAAVEDHRGSVVKMVGDGLHAAFGDPLDAVRAALQAQLALADPAATNGVPLRIRCGLHAGPVERRDNDYFGGTVNRAARIMSAAHGGQVLLSQSVVESIGGRLPPGATLRDLGSVRLRDLASPEHVYQIVHPELRQEFPALRSLEATPNNLPQQLTSFIGRERVLAEVKSLLAKARLLTLTGTGGLGKTRLSLQAAADVMDDYADGVWLVELAPIADARLVPQAVASVLGLMEEAGRSALESLTKYVRDRNLLLILDNCEHLVGACAELANRLLQAGAGVKVLASSREHLQVPGETAYPLPALALPDARQTVDIDALTEFDAVHLFVDRALAVQPSFKVTPRNAKAVAEICRHLDGIPLAIELAAARVSSLPVEKIAERLTDRFRLLTQGSRTALPRQQTLRALIDWSYDLLAPAEKRLFARLSVFAGGFVLEAAEAVGPGDGIASPEVLDLLTALVEKSLIEPDAGGNRYRFLETVREYARDRLRESGEEERLLEAHFAHFLALAEAASPHLTDAAQQTWLDTLETENDNLRAALTWSSSGGDVGRGLAFAAACWRLWFVRGYLTEGRRWISTLCAAAPPGTARMARATALSAAGVMAWQQGDYAAAKAVLEESLPIHRDLDNRAGMAAAISNLGNIETDQGDFAAARAHYEQSLAIQRELGDPQRMASSFAGLGNVAAHQGDLAASRTLHGECLALMREAGDHRGIALALNNLGAVALDQGDYPAARALFEESLVIRRELNNRVGIAMSLFNLAEVARAQGEASAARTLYQESLAISRDLGDRQTIAESIEGLALVASMIDAPARAARLFGAAERQREDIGSPRQPAYREVYDRQVAKARAAMQDDGAFHRAWQDGRAMAVDDAIRHALDETGSGPPR